MKAIFPYVLQDPGKSLATLDRDTQFHLNAFSGKSFEVFRPLQPPVQTRGRNFKAVIFHILDGKQPRKVVADRGTVVNVHAADFVDEYPHQPAMIGKLNIDKLVAESAYCFFQQSTQVH